MVRFANTGSEAVQLALRIARGGDRPRHHRQVRGPLPRLARQRLRRPARPARTWRPAATSGCGPSSAGQDPAAIEHTEVLPWNDLDAVEARLARGDVAAVITEPLWRGYIRPAPGFLEGLREICTPPRDDPDLRRDRVRLPGRRRRRPGAVRRHAGPRDVRQGDGQRLPDRRRRRTARPDGPARRRAGRPSRDVQRQRPVDGGGGRDAGHAPGRARPTRRSSAPAAG